MNTSNYGMKFCTGIYNDHDQIMNSNNPNQTPSPYAPLLLLIYFSIITLTVSIWFKQFKNSVIEPLALHPEVAENMPFGSQVPDLCFQNPNYIRNPKMSSKQSVVVSTQ
jgi:hypothetical protein